MSYPRHLLVTALGLLVTACRASSPPPRLVEARSPKEEPREASEASLASLTPSQIELLSEGPTDIPPLPPPPYAKTSLAAFDALRAATSVELFRLDPGVNAGAVPARRFHDYFVVTSGVGRAPASVVSTLVAAAEHGGPTAVCFLPHHGVRVRTPQTTYDLVICFRCHQIEVYEGDRHVAMLATQDVTTAMDKAFAANGL